MRFREVRGVDLTSVVVVMVADGSDDWFTGGEVEEEEREGNRPSRK
jgi:phenylpyruvate tautomerase PptA (4-oxalocrotonate tautomerase family)